MKNKILSYLFAGLLVLSLCHFFGYVNADCNEECAIAGIEGKSACITECEAKNKATTESAWTQWSQKKECKDWCCGIKLNTNFPIIWNCIWGKGKTDSTTAFPTMIWALTKIVMSLVLVACFILIIYAGILWSADKPKEAKERLKRVAITILLLWFSGVILRLINPNFFS